MGRHVGDAQTCFGIRREISEGIVISRDRLVLGAGPWRVHVDWYTPSKGPSADLRANALQHLQRSRAEIQDLKHCTFANVLADLSAKHRRFDRPKMQVSCRANQISYAAVTLQAPCRHEGGGQG